MGYSLGLCVPVMVNFKGFTELMRSVDLSVTPVVVDNWNKNIGVSKAWNRGLEAGYHNDWDALYIINDDVVLEKRTLEKLLIQLRDHASTLDLVTANNTRDYPYGDGPVNEPDYSCFAVRPRDFVEKFGFFDENFSPAYFEDNDMAYRIKLEGGGQERVPNANMFHEGSVTQYWDGEVVTSPMFERNRSYYATKWGGYPGDEKFTLPFNGITGKKSTKDWNGNGNIQDLSRITQSQGAD